MFDSDLIDALLHSVKIEDVIASYIPVEKRGRNYMAVCPFHDDTNPSLSISPEKQIFKCFVCGTGGNAIGFIQEYEKCSFVEAVKKLAEFANFHDPRLEQSLPKKPSVDPAKQKLYDCIDALQAYYEYSLTIPEGEKARAYLAQRHLDDAQRKKYGIGYAPIDGKNTANYLVARGHSLKSIEDIGIATALASGTSDKNAGRLIFPLHSPSGQVVGFSARQLEKDGTSKYINSPETPIFRKGENLYNYHRASKTAHHDGYCYLLEGFMDVMALDKAGIPNALALMGTALTKEQVALLKKLRCEIRLCLDGDKAGQTGMMKASLALANAKVPFKIVDYGQDLRDPDDILQEEGPEALKAKMNNLVDAMDFQLSYYLNFASLDSPQEKQKVLAYFASALREEEGIELENHIAKLSKALKYEASAIRLYLQNSKTDAGAGFRLDFTAEGAGNFAPSAPMTKRLTKRLAKAEDTILYYMLSEAKAREYINREGNPICSGVERDIAFYILDYAKDHPDGDIDIAGLSSFIQQSDEENGAKAAGRIADLAMGGKAVTPYSDDTMRSCIDLIETEKAKANQKMRVERAIASGDSSLATSTILAFAEQKGKDWNK